MANTEHRTEGTLLTVAETAEMLRMTPAALRYRIHVGDSPKSALLGGRRRMFRRADVEAYIANAFGGDAR